MPSGSQALRAGGQSGHSPKVKEDYMDSFRVLVVDDEKDFLETLVNRLAKRNIDATGVPSGEEAIKMMNEKLFDVVILDIKMPGGMDGIECLREIKRIQPITEVILLTGHASVETSIEGMKLGAFDYLMKPIKLEDLMIKLAEAFEKKDAHDQKNSKSQDQRITAFSRKSAPTGKGRKKVVSLTYICAFEFALTFLVYEKNIPKG